MGGADAWHNALHHSSIARARLFEPFCAMKWSFHAQVMSHDGTIATCGLQQCSRRAFHGSSFLTEPMAMHECDAAIAAIARRERYARQVRADPFPPQFRQTCTTLWRLKPSPDLLAPFTNWWLQRFRRCVTALLTPDATIVAGWIALENTAGAGNNLPQVSDWHLPTVHATVFLYEWNTSTWLATQNAKGVAVPSHLVVEHYLAQLRATPLQPPWVARALGPFQRRTYHNKWLQWFRLRWGIKWRRIPLSNPMPHDDTRRKALTNDAIQVLQKLLPRPLFEQRFTKNVSHGCGPKMGPKMGPDFGPVPT